MYEHAYKLLYIFRPLVWVLVGYLILIFGNRFLKKLLNAIAIFLLIMSVAAAALSTHMINQVIWYGYDTYDNEFTYAIVALVMTIALLLCSILYFQFALSVGKGDGEPKDKKKRRDFTKAMILAVLYPFCFMGFSIPFFFMEEAAGKVVGVIIEIIALLVLIARIKLTINRFKED